MSAPSVIPANASLPVAYESAKVALAECDRVDECKDWSDKAAALASYAKQAEDDALERYASRIRARAIRRAGELLKQFDARDGQNLPNAKKAVAHHFSQREAAQRAGMSPHQTKQAVRVANVPQDQFDAAVEADRPPTISQLAAAGIKRRNVVDLKGVPPKEFNRALHYVGDLHEACRILDDCANAGLPHHLNCDQMEKVAFCFNLLATLSRRFDNQYAARSPANEE